MILYVNTQEHFKINFAQDKFTIPLIREYLSIKQKLFQTHYSYSMDSKMEIN